MSGVTPIVVVKEEEYKVDYDKDGKDDVAKKVTTTTDVNADGKVDVVETSLIVKDEDGNIIHSSIDAKSDDLSVDGSSTIDYSPASEESQLILKEIEELKSKVSCEKVQHMGSMNDYAELFKKAQDYMKKAGDKNIDLVIDTSTLDKFALEAEVYSKMFSEVSIQFERLTTVSDTESLRKVRDGLAKIALMYENIQKFKATITASSVLQVPESIKTVSEHLQSVTESLECSLTYLEFFADNSKELSEEQQRRAELNDEDKVAISAAIKSLDVWLEMINNEANVTMNSNAYINAFKNRIAKFGPLNDRLSDVVKKVSEKLANWKLGKF